ncbi:haloacid dehalogenase, type II [Oceanicola granulosus HTCC2516]|uniref:(S)-2-haloacid dehalogenase n=1 Tax=Oceanicola granulosus (strain ATCC BAA-861 / DSM 15982 / KCTC 12143 / HTCC2516) TaxID=314256 RepID=Q2CC69_OCEGH|nr:haloacid dehalogenase type II [Oceanicola granulosus]EAR50291.1 haloacid dehalogenase, type II [Oceanicola granulosus HTCC2516]
MTTKACIFDAYGTLFDVTAAARTAAEEPGGARLAEAWPALARDWRAKQLSYTWLRAVAGRHCDFWQVTQDALDWALEAAGIDDPELRERLLALYWELDAYPEVPAMLAGLKRRGLATGILSNGSPEMLEGAIGSAQIGEWLDAVLSVEAVGVFKPHASVYELVPARFGCAPGEVLFVSSNGWDAAGAADFGFRTLWVNRTGEPVDRLYARPDYVAPDLTGLDALL